MVPQALKALKATLVLRGTLAHKDPLVQLVLLVRMAQA